MAMERFDDDLKIIAGLGDDPKRDDGLTTQGFKSIFDKAGLLIQDFINNKLIPYIEKQNVGLPLGGGKMEGPINMNGQSLSGLNVPTKDDEPATKGYVEETTKDFATETFVNDAVKTAAPRNLLDNSYFYNPVNQRGAISYTGTYGIDRWRVWNEDTIIWNINNGIGVEVAGKMFQYLELNNIDVTKTYTLAVSRYAEESKEIIILTKTVEEYEYNSALRLGFGTDNDMLVVTLGTGTYGWAALYEGEYTAETLPVYQPKGYGAELAACQRYFVGIFGSYCGFNNFDSNSGSVKITTPVPMRFDVIPTLNAPYLSGEVYLIVGEGNALTSGQLTVNQVTNDGIILTYVTEVSRKRQPVVLNIDNYIYLSSDL